MMSLNAKYSGWALALALCTAPHAQAAIVTYTGDTTAGPTFDRPFEDLSGISLTGTGVHYSAYSFTVGLSGDYTFALTGLFDTFAILYDTSFIPASALTNALVANDDALTNSFNVSGFAETLTAGTTYVFVTTGFDPNEFGAFSVTIGGPGSVVSAVPEPQTYAMLALGLALVGGARRRLMAPKA